MICDMEEEVFEFLDGMSDDWFVAGRLKKKGDKESLEKLRKMEKEKLVLIDSLEE